MWGGCLLVLFGVFIFVCFCFAVLGCFLLVVWFGFVFGGFCVCVGYYLFGFSFKFHYTIAHVVIMNMSPGDTKSFHSCFRARCECY